MVFCEEDLRWFGMKTVLILWAITIAVAVVGWQVAFNRGDTIKAQEIRISTLEKEKTSRETYIKNAQAKGLEDSETIKKLREQAKKPVSVCDCYNSVADSNVVDILREHGQK